MGKYRMQDVLQYKWHKLWGKIYCEILKESKELKFKITNEAQESNASTFIGSLVLN